jgi:hypothetical protein
MVSGEFGTIPSEQWFKYNPYAEWYYNTMRIEGSPTRQYHIENYGEDFDYWDFHKVATAHAHKSHRKMHPIHCCTRTRECMSDLDRNSMSRVPSGTRMTGRTCSQKPARGATRDPQSQSQSWAETLMAADTLC